MQENFVEKIKNLGEIPEGSVISIEYLKTPECPNVMRIDVSCGACTTAHNWPDKVIVQYTSGNISDHLIQHGHKRQDFDRGVTVVYQDQSYDYLRFVGQIVKQNAS